MMLDDLPSRPTVMHKVHVQYLAASTRTDHRGKPQVLAFAHNVHNPAFEMIRQLIYGPRL